MRTVFAWSLAFVLLTVASCGGGNKGEAVSEPATRESAPADANTTDLIAAVGDGSALVFVFRDDGWGEIRESFVARFEGVASGIWERMAKTADPVAGVWLLTELLELGLQEPTLEGRDLSRPIVVSAFEGPYDGPPGAAIAMSANTDGRHPPSRYQAVIPATDVRMLTASLQTWLSASGKLAPELVEGRKGAIGFRLGPPSSRESHVAILPGPTHVRVVLLHDSHGFGPSDVRPWLDVTRIELPDTPSLRHAASKQPMAVLVRPWRLRAFGAWSGLEQSQRANESVSLSQVNAARSRGLAIAASIALLTPDSHAEFDDWAFAASGTGGKLSVTAVASLTEQGQKVWQAGTKVTEPPFKLKRKVIADAFVSADVLAMLAAAGKHEAPEGSMSDLIGTYRMCGGLCPTFFALRWPFAGLKTVSGVVPPIGFATEAGLLGAHFVWVDDGPSGPAWAVAVIGGDAPSSTLGPLLKKMSPGESPQRHEVVRDGKTVVLLGIGVDPTTVFDTEVAVPNSSDVARFRVKEDALGLPAPLEGKLSMAGTALTAEVVFGPGALAFSPDFRGLSWPSPMQSAPTSEAADCLRDAVGIVHRQLDAAARSLTGDSPGLYAAAYAAAAARLHCAGKDSKLTPAVRHLGDTVAIIAARGHLAQAQVDDARAILGKQCKSAADTGPACDAATALGKVRTPKLWRDADAARCNPDHRWNRAAPMVVDGDQVLFAGRTAKATPSAVSELLIDAISMEERYQKSAPTVALAIPGDTPFGEVLPVFSGIAALGGLPNPLVRGDGGDLIMIHIDAELGGTLSVDWKVAEGYRPEFAEEEEEPPPQEVPAGDAPAEEGKMGKPTSKSKSGLYAMKGPKRLTPSSPHTEVFAVELTKSELAVVLPDGTRVVLPDAAAIGKMAGETEDRSSFGRQLVETLTVAPDVPWSRYVDVAIATCNAPLILVRP